MLFVKLVDNNEELEEAATLGEAFVRASRLNMLGAIGIYNSAHKPLILFPEIKGLNVNRKPNK